MNCIYIPTEGPEDWRRLLVSPDKQWRDGYSAKSLAEAWETADGFPEDVRNTLGTSGIEAFKNMVMLLGIPEYKVPLPGGAAASQNDLFVLAKGKDGQIVIMVEGKVNESFGPYVSEWLKGASEGKKKRLAFLCDTLGLQAENVYSLRYQLLHRAASALITAERFGALHALMLVHSFSGEDTGFDDFASFCNRFDEDPDIGQVQSMGILNGVSFYAAWVKNDLLAGP